MLSSDHREVEDLVERFDKARGDRKESIAREICLALTVHAQLEEELIYAMARELLGNDASDLIDAADVEHATVKRLVVEVESSSLQDALCLRPSPTCSCNYRSWAAARYKKGLAVPGPYARNPDPEATMLGERQWTWLEHQLRVPADVRLVGSSLQVLADFPGWEGWHLFAHDQQRLIEVIRRTRANGVVFLSGDTHYAEVSKLDVNVPYTLWDMTASGLTEVWPVPTPNSNRVSSVLREPNFGLVEIDWQGVQTTVTLSVVDQHGARRIEQRLPIKDLQLPP